MPREIILTAVPITNQEAIQALLDRFEEQTGIHVVLRWIEWGRYRQETVNISLQRQRADVSMVGMPVTSDLEGMNVLRPFAPREIASIGGAAAFLPARWQSGIRPDSPNQVWAVPMCLDVRILAYWRDMLEQAGIDEATAFTRHANVEQTVRRLKEAGMPTPWSMPTYFQLLHSVSSWIWEEGGDIFSPNGRRVIFHEPPAIRGMRAFFSLAPYADPVADQRGLDARLFNREVAMGITTPNVLNYQSDPRLGVTALPGGSYVGGVDLVIWGQTVDEQASLELVRFLTQPALTQPPSQVGNYVPVRTEELENPAHWTTPAARGLANAALHGRAYPCVAMVGLVEERLSFTLEQILKDLYANPSADLETTIHARIDPLARRINLSLSQE